MSAGLATSTVTPGSTAPEAPFTTAVIDPCACAQAATGLAAPPRVSTSNTAKRRRMASILSPGAAVWRAGLLGHGLEKLLVLTAVAAADDAAQPGRGRRQAFESEPAAAVARAPVGRLVGQL